MRRIGPHNHAVISVIVGSFLGDGYGNKRSGEGVKICFRQSVKHKEYLFWLYNFFYSQGYTSNLQPREYTRRKPQSQRQVVYKGYEFNTFAFRSLNWIYELFYKKGIKVVSPQIENYLTPLALAVWIMDDGGWINYGERIASNHFTLSEVTLLCHILKNKYNLDTTIQCIWVPAVIKQKTVVNRNLDRYSIYINKSSIPALISIILPYMHKSMHHKLGLV